MKQIYQIEQSYLNIHSFISELLNSTDNEDSIKLAYILESWFIKGSIKTKTAPEMVAKAKERKNVVLSEKIRNIYWQFIYLYLLNLINRDQ